MDPLLTLSGTHLAALIRAREITSGEVVDAHIQHIERVNPTLNAMVANRFEAARREAREADRRLGEAGLGPLHGVPCSIKESFGVEGMPNTAGLVARRGVTASCDAVAVARLRAAGAIPLGVTNVSELCMWMESNNHVYGRSRNPYDPTRTVGGSSGGEGAIVGAGGAPFGLGADVGGSIRMPAFFNGVFGHKPTGGLVDNAGQFPVATEAAERFLSTGPLARRAEDLAPLLAILAGAGAELGDPAGVALAGLEVISVEGDGRVPVTGDLLRAQRAAASALAARGARVRTAQVPGLARSVEIWGALLDAAGGPSFSSMLGQGTEIRAGLELLRWVMGRSPHTLPALALALVEKLPKLMPSHGARFVEEGAALRRELSALLGPRAVMLYPSHPRPAPRHDHAMFPPWSWGYTAIFNVMEVPVTQAPLGLNPEGLPLGVQIVGGHGQDHVTIAVALALEEAFGGWIPPALAKR